MTSVMKKVENLQNYNRFRNYVGEFRDDFFSIFQRGGGGVSFVRRTTDYRTSEQRCDSLQGGKIPVVRMMYGPVVDTCVSSSYKAI